MKRSTVWTLTMAIVTTLGVMAVQADEHTDGPEILAQIYKVKVLPGHALNFEKALKKHQQMHRDAGDPWERHAWVVVAASSTAVGAPAGSVRSPTGAASSVIS